jgi:hypothetical protein
LLAPQESEEIEERPEIDAERRGLLTRLEI